MGTTARGLIENHLARYCFAVDNGTADDIAALFWDDAHLEFNGSHVGYAAIRRCYADWIARMRDPVDEIRHLLYVPLIEIEGKEADATTYVDADALTRRSGRVVQLRACYRDRLAQRNGEWRFAERRIVGMRSFTAPRE